MKALLLFLFSTSLLAAPLKLDLSKAKSSVKFTATGNPSALVITGEAEGLTGVLSREGTKASGEAEFDLTKLKTGISLRDTHMKEKYLETKKYPKAKLKLLTLPEGSGAFTGELTLHGVTKRVYGAAAIDLKDGKLHAVASFPIDVTDFKISVPEFMEITVAKRVEVVVEVSE